jgi:hypothetical protein
MMRSPPADLVARAVSWHNLDMIERRYVARGMRASGSSYGEIQRLIPVAKSTLSGWLRDVSISDTRRDAIEERRKAKDNHCDTQWRRRLEIEQIREEAADFAAAHLTDPFFVAGVVMYWAEGSKTRNDLSMVNSDPRALRLFIAWTRAFHGPNSQFVLKLNLHEGNDEAAARAYWSDATGLGDVGCHKTFAKPNGTGHRRNHLVHGICQVRVRAAADAWQRTMTWIGVLASDLQLNPPGSLPSGR